MHTLTVLALLWLACGLLAGLVARKLVSAINRENGVEQEPAWSQAVGIMTFILLGALGLAVVLREANRINIKWRR